MNEIWQKDIAKEYIKEKVLNKELVEIQESLSNLKKDLSLGESNSNLFGVENIMNIIFNKEGKKRSRLGFEASKLKSFMYMIISNEGKENLDLLYNELNKYKSEEELKKNLGLELSNLETEVTSIYFSEVYTPADDNSNEQNTPADDNSNEQNTPADDNSSEQNTPVDDNSNEQNTPVDDNSNERNKNNIESFNNNENYIYNQAKLYGLTDNSQIAYVLATVKGECNFKNIKEIGGENKKYGKKDKKTGQCYYGRGFVQLTHKSNYDKFTKIINRSGLNFRDNKGNILVGKNIDLVNNPDLILNSNDLAAFILIYGMKNGSFTGKSLDDYINKNKTDFRNARRIINGTDKANSFAENANNYLHKLGTKKIETKKHDNILIGPELLAKNNTQIGGLGNSMMTGFQGPKNNKEFPNMNGIEGKSTKTHPNRFKDKQDVKNYVKDNKGIKSFMFYFGANTKNNKQTLSDIKQRSEWFENEGVQPILCTCIGENNHPHLVDLNKEILNLGKQKNWPVLDFASSYNKGEINMGNNKHPTSQGYKKMSKFINDCLV